MTDLSLHLAPNAPAAWLLLLTLALVALGLWAYRFAIPPLPVRARRALPALRIAGITLLLWLLARPVLERSARDARVVVLLDRSRSMELPGGPHGPTRAERATAAVEALKRAWRGRAAIEVLPFASRLGSDSVRAAGGLGSRGATALGDALAALGARAAGQRASAVVVVSDGAVNAGEDPVVAARTLGLPVHAIGIGAPAGPDRALAGVEASEAARVGQSTPVRVRVTSTEAPGTPFRVRLVDGDRELGRATLRAPGGGAEVGAEFRVTPTRSGLAVWTARVDSLAGEISRANNARQVAVDVAPGRTGVLIASGGPNWDLTFLRRALLGDSSLRVVTWMRERGGWRPLGREIHAASPEADLKQQAVVVLDAVAPPELGGAFDAELARLIRNGGGLLLLGGPPPGLLRYRGGALGGDLRVETSPSAVARTASPAPSAEARELLAWDDDPARGDAAWRAAAPLADLFPLGVSAGDRVLIAAAGDGPPLMIARRIGRGQALLVNGTGLWRWSLSPYDALSAERGQRLWRHLAQWIAEPVQGEPLRVRAERWLAAGGEPVRLFATLQDSAFRPVAGARVEGEVQDAAGGAARLAFEPQGAGSYVATLEDPAPGRYRVSLRASRAGRELGRAATEFAVDRWSLEEARVQPDTATLAAMVAATGGRITTASQASRWARALEPRVLARGRGESARLWESPWLFAVIVGTLSIEWAWRRRRGLP